MPAAIGTGQPDSDFLKANPRGEVPALIDGDVTIFDSTIILEYIEDKWPEPALLPRDAAGRARARMIEEVMDTSFEPINWGLGEIRWFKRAEGERARTLEARAMVQARGLYHWLTRQLGEHDWFEACRISAGPTFRWCPISTARPGSASDRTRPFAARPLAGARKCAALGRQGRQGRRRFHCRHGGRGRRRAEPGRSSANIAIIAWNG